jgi:hypothetical protein
MPKKYVLTTPVVVGDFTNQLTITELRLVAFSFNFQKSYTAVGKAIMSIMLADQNDDYHLTFTYEDAQALAFAQAIDAGNFSVVSLTEQIFNKLQSIPDSEGKTLPPGIIV